MQSIRVKRFDPKSIKQHRIIFLVGKRHTGKTCLMQDLLSHMPKPDFVMGMTPTEDTAAVFREFMPDTCIFNAFNQEKLERMLSVQRELIRRGKSRSVLLIMDDCLYQKGVLRSSAMRDLFFNGRHLNCSLICCAQYLMDITPELRTNIDYLCSMRENIIVNRQKLHKNYFGQFARFDDFDRVMTACTQNYSALIMDATISTTLDPTDCIFWYRAAPNPPPFRLARDVHWKLSKKCVRDDSEQRKAQARQFEIEAAAAEAGVGRATVAGTAASRVMVVQTEDEHGEVVSTA